MEKVQITQEQADAIERWENGTQLLKAVVVGLLKHGEDEPIKEMTTETLAKAIYIGYEVEPEFVGGEWVLIYQANPDNYGTNHVIYGQIDTIAFEDVIGNFSDGKRHRFHRSEVTLMQPSQIAKEKERRFFKKHDREPWELRNEDVLTRYDDGSLWEVTRERDVFKGYYLNGDSYNLEDIKNQFSVLAFYKDRLDGDSDE